MQAKVQITADALVVIRANSPLAREVGVNDPYAHYFVTDRGRKMAELAQSLDPVYTPFNLVRYKWFEDQLIAAANTFKQVLVLGAGYDFRPTLLPEFQGGDIQVYEVDYKSTLESKWSILESKGVNPADQDPTIIADGTASRPVWIHPVAADLSDATLVNRLIDAGYKISEPTFVMTEGVLFFLPETTVRALLDPQTLRLSKGSKYIFDFWTSPRIAALNQRLFQKTGKPLFQDIHISSPSEMSEFLRGNQFISCKITALDEIATQKFRRSIPSEFQNAWLVVRATL